MSRPRPRFPLGLAAHPAGGALGAYALLGLLVFLPLLPRLTTHILADDIFIRPGESDAYNFLWGYWWIHKAVSTGQSPLHCDWVLPPTGANLVFHTDVLLPALLTWPLGRWLGPVAGYNLMVCALVVLGAWSYFLFLRRALAVSWFAAFVVGAGFGFSPYFVFKTHAHIHLVGACFWATALGVLVTRYRERRFDRTGAVLFAVFLWASFWASFVEFFMLVMVSALVVVVFEASSRDRGRADLGGRVRFFLPALLGGFSLVVFLAAPEVSAVEVPLAATLTWKDLLSFPRLSMFAPLGTSQVYEHWGTFLPASFLVLAGVGVAYGVKERQHHLVPFGILAAVVATLTLDPGQWASTGLRALPLGGGFRVFARFFPFFLFFFLVFAGLGVEALWRRWRFRGRRGLVTLLLLGAAVELYPYRMQPSPVKQLPMTSSQRARLDRHCFVLVIPHGQYLQVHDTYQIALDLPCVNLSYVSRESDSVYASRMSRYGMVYGMAPVSSVAALYAELRALNVGYVLAEDKHDLPRLPLRGEVVAEWASEALLEVSAEF